VAPDAIFGRTDELGVVSRFFDRERTGAGGLLIEGEAGIGKTTVWREAVRIAEGQGMVLTSRASEAEARLSFTVLGDLLVPVLDDDVLGQLPVGQRRGLEVALLLAETPATSPDARAVSLAVLAVLRVLASSGPVTIAVDDVQWVDSPSARTLAFALRRLDLEPVTVVAARRLGSGSGEPLDLVGEVRVVGLLVLLRVPGGHEGLQESRGVVRGENAGVPHAGHLAVQSDHGRLPGGHVQVARSHLDHADEEGLDGPTGSLDRCREPDG